VVTPGSEVAVASRTHVSHRGTQHVSLVDLLDRLLQGGVVIQGDIMLSVAGIDLVELDLRVLVAAVDKVAGR
jgi:hypothetical protein